MNPADLTTDMIRQAVTLALETQEGANLYTPGPYTIDLKLLGEPYAVIYTAADYKDYQRTFTLEIVGEQVNAILSGDRQEVTARTVWVPVGSDAAPAFSFDGQAYAERRKWSGLIFRAGKYPDKGVEFTPDDLKNLAENFPQEGVPVMSEHEDSLIGVAMHQDGARLNKVWLENGGAELHGEIESPGWLDYALRSVTKSVSVGIDATKRFLREISLVLNPRVADAAVFRRDVAVAFSSTPAFKAIPEPIQRALNDLAQPAKTPAPAPARASQETHPMNFQEKTKAAFDLLTPEQRAQVGLTPSELDNPANFAAPVAKADPRDNALARMAGQSALNGLKAEGFGVPDAPFLALFTQAVKSDGGGGVTFSDEGDVKTGDAVKAVLELAKSAKKVRMGVETLNSATFSDENAKSESESMVEAAKKAAGTAK